ncbi:symplekin-like isoform X1 [Saccostrea echinata]|uniref:symplekin-like isoform X1 n=2 Tax=Saccostrea echinata TaxID=191078 RepID=UPI002A838FFE|nr:symplekin-like isoform X1 [Saccostrea echinata]
MMAATENRRSTAAQFFMDEETTHNESVSTYDKVVELLNQASLVQKDQQKINILRQVQELIIHKDPTLLDNFLDEMLAFQSDRSVDVKKYVITFMEEACKKDPELLNKILPCLQILLQDDNVNVQKKVILSLPQVYKVIIKWLAKAKTMTEEKSFVWETMKSLKNRMFELIDSENDGVRTHVVKFMEGVILTLSRKTPESEVPKSSKPEAEVTLDIIPEDNKFLRVKRLEEQGRQMFDTLLQFQASPHISSINLMTVMGSLTTIARQRPVFFGKVVQSFETLQVNLPPTLAKSQVSSVRKNMKMHMLSLLKHKASVDYITQITTLLTDLGATNSEVMKSMPKIDESRKRKAEEAGGSMKKAKTETEIELDDDDAGMTPFVDRSKVKAPATLKQRQTAVDITAEDIIPRLTPQNVADLVLISMVMLPDQLPPHFQATYTPIAAAGTEGQIKHMGRLLANQLTAAGMGKGIAEVQIEEASVEDGGASPEYQPTSPKQVIQTVVGGLTEPQSAAFSKSSNLPTAPQIPSVRPGIKQFKLSAVTTDLDRDRLDEMTIASVRRILEAEKSAALGNALPARTKLLTSLVSQFGGELKNLLQEYIFEDLRNRADVAFAWLYQEYANCQGFCASSLRNERSSMASYDECLTRLLSGLLERTELTTKEGLFHRLILEAPAITDNAIQILKKYCMDKDRVVSGINTLRQLILTRPAHRLRYLEVLLMSCHHDMPEVRATAIHCSKQLYEKGHIRPYIEQYATKMLKNLLLTKPPTEMLGKSKNDPALQTWTEDTIKMCLYLYLGLLPSNHKLIHQLAMVYTSAGADIKRIILRALENPVKGMGMKSPELLTLVESCPKGAETLVTRVIHILTDKASPSPELVERVRDLYHKRVPDVRFLIPVLTGLSKDEVIQALPKLIKLNPIVVKEVFNRLLGGHSDANYTSPLTPVDLLIALHNIDPAKCDMKTIIKATNLCFSEKNIYTQEVLAVVMKTLMEQDPLPTLFMRTVLQSLSMYPRLMGFILNILQRLIAKEVWKNKKVWEGFIRCCQKMKPQSFAVLLQLKAPQLKSVFESCPDLREPLLNHVNSFAPNQKAHLPKSVLAVLENPPEVTPITPQAEVAPPTPVPFTPTVLAPQVTTVKIENTVVPMETQSIQSVQSIQTIGSNLVQVKQEPPDPEEIARQATENREPQESGARDSPEKDRKEMPARRKSKRSTEDRAETEMEEADSPENALAIAEETMDTSVNNDSQGEQSQDSTGDHPPKTSRSKSSESSSSEARPRRSTRSRK